MKKEELHELLYQALETEQGGVEVYTTALRCVVNEELKTEWEEYLEQTQNHVRIVESLLADMGLDPETETPGRLVVRHIGHALVKAMDMALGAGKPEAAQLVAAECIVLAETKDHLNWELIGELAKKAKGDEKRALKEAYDEVEEEEDEHLYHTMGWSRELWIRGARHARGPAAARGGEGSEDRHRRGPGQARSQGNAVGKGEGPRGHGAAGSGSRDHGQRIADDVPPGSSGGVRGGGRDAGNPAGQARRRAPG
jgi:hypothetical protein